MSVITAQIQLRRDTAANWTANDPILLVGEIALTTDLLYSGTDQPRYKIGNGIDTWLNLDYVPEGNEFPENLYLTVVNKTGDNLLASGYKVLKVQDAQGQRLAVDYALADSDANSADTIGVVYENIDNNQTGKIVVIGELTGIDTTGNIQGETWTDGDLLFLSPFVYGEITNIKPTAPNHTVIIGYVAHTNANNGKIYIKIDNGYELGELHNVYAPTPNNNDGIFWSSGTTRYENKSITTVLGYTPESSANKGIANGYAPLGNDTKVDASYLPSYVSDVLEYANLAAFPVTGTSNKIYVALDTNKVYRWSGSIYVEVSANSGVWGAITGNLANQTDLINYIKTQNLFYQTVGHNFFSQSPSTTYYYGSFIYFNAFTSNTTPALSIMKTGVINEALIQVRANVPSGSFTIQYQKNFAGAWTTLHLVNLASQTPSYTMNLTGLSISVTKGDLLSFRNVNNLGTNNLYGTIIDLYIQ